MGVGGHQDYRHNILQLLLLLGNKQVQQQQRDTQTMTRKDQECANGHPRDLKEETVDNSVCFKSHIWKILQKTHEAGAGIKSQDRL